MGNYYSRPAVAGRAHARKGREGRKGISDMRMWSRGWGTITHAPQLRDALTRAKDANPTTLLTRFAEELPPSPRLRRTCRRAPEAGGGGEERLVFGLGGIF